MKDNKIHVLTIRFQVYIFLIASVSAGITGLFLRDDAFNNLKLIFLMFIGIVVLLIFILFATNNYVETNKLIKKDRK